jgi:23S rRNA (uracil1939-C5)-methyltransferase
VEPLDLVATAMAAGGAAIARDAGGRIVFVEGALPGERVRAEVVTSKKDFARAVALDVLEASPDRIAPPCAARVAGCGGCSWQHVRPDAQTRLKADIVADALRRIGRFPDAAASVAIRPLPPGGRPVRTTARLGVDPSGRAGQRRHQGHEVVATDACLAAHPRLEELIVGGRFAGADEVTLRVGVASDERAVLVTPAEVAIAVPDDVRVGEGAVVHESVAGAWLQVSISSFFQSGPLAAEALVAAVDDAIGNALPGGGHLVDAYAGVGLFGATVGRAHHARITSIETDGPAIDDARVNLADLDATVVQGEVGRWQPSAGDAPVDVVVADPARSGLGRPGVAALLAAAAPRLVLVSCDPASLARDARLLVDGGYDLASVELVDAFPDTFHVEAVTRFDRR